MSGSQRRFTCTTCAIEIEWEPIFHVGLPFCCAGCVADGPCSCSYDGPRRPARRAVDGLARRRSEAPLPLQECAPIATFAAEDRAAAPAGTSAAPPTGADRQRVAHPVR